MIQFIQTNDDTYVNIDNVSCIDRCFRDGEHYYVVSQLHGGLIDAVSVTKEAYVRRIDELLGWAVV